MSNINQKNFISTFIRSDNIKKVAKDIIKNKKIIMCGISLVIVAIVILSFGKDNVTEYQKDAILINDTMDDMEDSFIYMLGVSNKSECKNWIKVNRKDMKDAMTTKLGRELVNEVFDMYEITLDAFDKYDAIGNNQLGLYYLEEINEEPKLIKINDKVNKLKVELINKSGLGR